MHMTLRNRILDMLPALIVFAIVAAFGTYCAIAFVERDPLWLRTVAQVRRQHDAPAAPSPTQAPTAIAGDAGG